MITQLLCLTATLPVPSSVSRPDTSWSGKAHTWIIVAHVDHPHSQDWVAVKWVLICSNFQAQIGKCKFTPSAVCRIMPGTAQPLWTQLALGSISWWLLLSHAQEMTVSCPCHSSNSSLQCFPGCPAACSNTWRIFASFTPSACSCRTWIYVAWAVTPLHSLLDNFSMEQHTHTVQNDSCFKTNLYYLSGALKALFTGCFSFRHSSLTLHKAFQRIFSFPLLFSFWETSIVKILAFSYHRKRP